MSGLYRTIVADPPWDVGRGPDWGSGGASRPLEYPTMSLDEIAALPVRDLAEKRSHLYVWTINAYIEDTYEIVRLWGFRPVVLLTWAKPPHGIGLGGTYVQTTEHVLFARRGICPASERIDRTCFQWPRGPHSAKPEAFLDIVETVSPPPSSRALRPPSAPRLGHVGQRSPTARRDRSVELSGGSQGGLAALPRADGLTGPSSSPLNSTASARRLVCDRVRPDAMSPYREVSHPVHRLHSGFTDPADPDRRQSIRRGTPRTREVGEQPVRPLRPPARIARRSGPERSRQPVRRQGCIGWLLVGSVGVASPAGPHRVAALREVRRPAVACLRRLRMAGRLR